MLGTFSNTSGRFVGVFLHFLEYYFHLSGQCRIDIKMMHESLFLGLLGDEDQAENLLDIPFQDVGGSDSGQTDTDSTDSDHTGKISLQFSFLQNTFLSISFLLENLDMSPF